MSGHNSQTFSSVANGNSQARNEEEVNAMMGFNRVDLGKDGLAGSCFATPGLTFGTKAEVIEEQARKKLAEKAKKEAEERQNGTTSRGDGPTPKPNDGIDVDGGAPSGAF